MTNALRSSSSINRLSFQRRGQMSDAPLSQSDNKHIRDAWIWAATIIAIGMLCAVGGIFAQDANQGSKDVQVSSYLP
jgi:hypothetical protein